MYSFNEVEHEGPTNGSKNSKVGARIFPMPV